MKKTHVFSYRTSDLSDIGISNILLCNLDPYADRFDHKVPGAKPIRKVFKLILGINVRRASAVIILYIHLLQHN